MARKIVTDRFPTLHPSGHDRGLAADILELRDKALSGARDENALGYRFGKWLQSAVLGDPAAARFCRDRNMPMIKAENEGVNSAGGVVVPDEFADAIIVLREAYGVVRRCARVWPSKLGSTAHVPRRSAGASATWATEGGSISTSQPSYDSIALSMHKLGIMLKMSSEIEEDAIDAFAAFIIDEIAWCFAEAEDNAAFNGTGDAADGRIVGIGARLADGNHGAGNVTASADTYGALTAADFGALIGALPARSLPGAKIFVSTVGYGNFFTRIAAVSGGLIATVGSDGTINANFQGFPIVFTPSLPSVTSALAGELMMVAGNVSQGIALGERRVITVRRLGERFADLDQVAFLATERVDINFHDSGNNTAAGALVGLFGS